MNRMKYMLLISLLFFIVLGCQTVYRNNSEEIKQEPISPSIVGSVDPLVHGGSNLDDTTKNTVETATLSPASKLLIVACDNYISINPSNIKVAEVMNLKASVYYDNKLFEKSRNVYKKIFDNYSGTSAAAEAIRMTAQSFYEEKNFELAQRWYRELKNVSHEGMGQNEAIARIAESIFRMGELAEKEKKYSAAVSHYERIVLEFPHSVIADVSLYNAGLVYEKMSDWSKAILMYQRLKNQYKKSQYIPKTHFRIAKCYELMLRWDAAAKSYLQLVVTYPKSDLSPTSLYNAAFCFENSENIYAAAKTYEKLAMSFPNLEDAADVLFKAGELYGTIKDWKSVTRVNQNFSKFYGNDKDRRIQAECMVGIALYMQDKKGEAIQQLKKTIDSHKAIVKPSAANNFYAAKAQFTIGDIYHEFMKKIILYRPDKVYKKLLKQKSNYLDNAVSEYTKVLSFKNVEWTTRAIAQIGKSYENFAFGLFQQERPDNLSIEQSLALELGIANAVEEYLISNAMKYYEQNVKFGIQNNIENKYIIATRKKLTFLTYTAGENFLDLVELAVKMEGKNEGQNLAVIGQKLSILQKIAPFQEKAFELFLRCLELGSMYQSYDKYYTKASDQITKISYTIAQTYSDVADIARSAPFPQKFDEYEKFVYKTKLIKQIEGYEENALTNYLKTVKISVAYEIQDSHVEKAKDKIAQLLFTRARCYDLLCLSVYANPPYPSQINESEKEEYKAQFEEIALTYQDQAFEVYRVLLEYANKNFAIGEYVKHAYVRLYQMYPQEYGVKNENIVTKRILSDLHWKCSIDSNANWSSLEFNDMDWPTVDILDSVPFIPIVGFPDTLPPMMRYKKKIPVKLPESIFFRRTFYSSAPPHKADFYLYSIDSLDVYFNNDVLVSKNDNNQSGNVVFKWDLLGKIRQGKNILAIEVRNGKYDTHGLFPLLSLKITTEAFEPKLPHAEYTLNKEELMEGVYVFPYIKNFSIAE